MGIRGDGMRGDRGWIAGVGILRNMRRQRARPPPYGPRHSHGDELNTCNG